MTRTLYFSLFSHHTSSNQHPSFFAAILTFHIFGSNGLQISKWCWAAGKCLCCGWNQFAGPCWDVPEQRTSDCLCCLLELPTAAGTVVGSQQEFPWHLWWWEHAKSHHAQSFLKTCCKPLLALGPAIQLAVTEALCIQGGIMGGAVLTSLFYFQTSRKQQHWALVLFGWFLKYFSMITMGVWRYPSDSKTCVTQFICIQSEEQLDK